MFRAALALMLCAVLAGCASKRAYHVAYAERYDPAEFARAASDREMLVRLHGLTGLGESGLIEAGFRVDKVPGTARLSDAPQGDTRLPYALVLLVDPQRPLQRDALCRGDRPRTLGAEGQSVRLHATLCRADKALAEFVADVEDPALFSGDGLARIVTDIVRLAADPQ